MSDGHLDVPGGGVEGINDTATRKTGVQYDFPARSVKNTNVDLATLTELPDAY